MRGSIFISRVFVSVLMAALVSSNVSFARGRLFSQVRILKPRRTNFTNRSRTQPAPVEVIPLRTIQDSHSEGTDAPAETILPQPSRPVIEEPPPKEEPKKAFGRTLAEAFRNRPRLFQQKEQTNPLDPNIKLFCEDPYRFVCEISSDQLAGNSWPNEILPRHAQGAFASGKKLLSFLTDNHFKYNETQRALVQKQLEETQILVTGIQGPMAFSHPPRVEVPPNSWNLFSVFHELGHMIDFKSTYPIDKGEVIQVIRRTSSISDIDAIERQFTAKQAEITADKITAQGFALLADPNIRKLGFEPISTSSLLKTVTAATGFLCRSQGGEEHPTGRFRINYIGADPDLRAVLGCPVSK